MDFDGADYDAIQEAHGNGHDELVKKLEEERRTAFHEKAAKEAADRLAERDMDLAIPHKCDAAYICPNAGVALEDIEPFTAELTGIVDKMEVELVNEKRILEGTIDPEYDANTENGFSDDKTTEEQWRPRLLFGSWTTDPIHISIPGSSSLSDTVNLLNLDSRMVRFVGRSSPASDDSCSEKLDDCGTETDAMNAFSECTVPMISEQTDGTQSEAKWSPHQRSTESLEVTLPDVKL